MVTRGGTFPPLVSCKRCIKVKEYLKTQIYYSDFFPPKVF
jgi:hypothetical protein